VHDPHAERVDGAVFALVPEFARASIDLVVTSPSASPALGAYAARVARRAADAEGAGRSPPDPEWRDAYHRLGLPDDLTPPHEALAAWARANGRLPSQGPILDLVNAYSLVARTPAAAYAVDDAAGGLWLRPARGHEQHESVAGEWSSPPVGELVLADGGDRVLARHWHGSQGRSFVPGPAARRVRIHIDVLGVAPHDAATRAGTEFARLAEAMLSATAAVQVVDVARAVIAWPDEQ
jgi:DNA/RNA-binding domain of Phe-tRNA-synthetase-like protein